ncbi:MULTISPECIES: NlpC/P60 family protein [Streptomyces]|uniref:C40 family peptidase n=1 Tax=Streptomyces TaxID=1883 RepID=UPI000477F39D|nr:MULTISPECIES: NlpC/P60 family protein [Streptomyces]MCW7987697.1 glycoside hydrolase [Streptomyces platensis subsp. clarensis]AWN31372.1 glycoside hydrolase [Streptomyces sp. NEAU-S7GS2]MCX5446346.1 NlpC/P60 family protein [Streptomyces libani]MYT17956.1 NlpC/P60 family protein [Streptomyces sp. SID4951]MYX08649.1 NlpC/P60 family protein [Streptomyces sp. SID8375]
MTVRMQTPNLLARAGTVTALTLVTLGGTTVAPGTAGNAEAATVSAHALRIAASKRGAPYQYGAQGPHAFDCSGLTLYSFKRAGRALPRTAAAQYGRTRHIPASLRRRGDLVFFRSAGGIYHVGIYAGRGRMWHAPKAGSVVRLERIWSRAVSYGRVG